MGFFKKKPKNVAESPAKKEAIVKAVEEEFNLASMEFVGLEKTVDLLRTGQYYISYRAGRNFDKSSELFLEAQMQLIKCLKYSAKIKEIALNLEKRLIATSGQGMVLKEDKWALAISKSIEKGLKSQLEKIKKLYKDTKNLEFDIAQALKSNKYNFDTKTLEWSGEAKKFNNTFEELDQQIWQIVRNLRVIITYIKPLKEIELRIKKLENSTV